MHTAFLDIEKAYDRVWSERLWEALKQYGVQGKQLRAIQGLYKDSEAAVKVGEYNRLIRSTERSKAGMPNVTMFVQHLPGHGGEGGSSPV